MGLARRLPEQAAEPARVVEAQHAAGIEGDVDVVMRAHRRVIRQHPQAAGHAQVEQGAAHGGVQQQVLGTPADALDVLFGQQFLDLARDRPAQVGATQQDVFDAASGHVRQQPATGGFDFG